MSNCQNSGRPIKECTCGYCSGQLIREGDVFLERLEALRNKADKLWTFLCVLLAPRLEYVSPELITQVTPLYPSIPYPDDNFKGEDFKGALN